MIHTFRTGGDRNLGYLVSDETTRKAVVIDPSYDPDSIYTCASENDYDILYVFNTHGHHDHTNGNLAFEAQTGVQALAYGDRDPVTGKNVRDGEEFPLGESTIRILHTPGHSTDSICLLIDGAVFTGDTLFVGKVGGTDLDAGARQEYTSLHTKLMTLPPETRVYPGHDVGVTPESTIEHEARTNPFLLCQDIDSFIDLKANWAVYKKEHGIA